MANAAKTRRMGEDIGIQKYQSALKQGGPTQSQLGQAIARQQKAAMGLFSAKRKQEGRANPMSAKGIQAPVQIQSQKTTEAELKQAFDPSRVKQAELGEQAKYQQTLAQGKATTDEAARRRAEQRAKVLQTIGKVGGAATKLAGRAAAGALTGGASEMFKAGTAGARALAGAMGSSPEQIQQQQFMADLQERARSGDETAKQQLFELYKG
tara:strand:- start:8618 stop:9247 length:630 start_codon:yes stop_codon:yes gene_type:complete